MSACGQRGEPWLRFYAWSLQTDVITKLARQSNYASGLGKAVLTYGSIAG